MNSEYMTKRELFALHAPPVPEWFQPVMPEKPKRPADPEGIVAAAYKLLCEYEGEWPTENYRALKDLMVRVQGREIPLTWQDRRVAEAHHKLVADWGESLRKWTQEQDVQRLVQWAYFYADAMVRS